MKKKIWLIALSLISALCCGLALAACGDDGEETWSMQRVYERAQDLGFEGSLEELIQMFKGERGEPGKDGKDGKDGTNGRGIVNVEIDAEGHLHITYSDGETLDLGKVVGSDGKDGDEGPKGENGANGENGEQGLRGERGKSAYELWLEQGYVGEIGTFFSWLRGEHAHFDPDGDGYCNDCAEHIHTDADGDCVCDGCEEPFHTDPDGDGRCNVCGSEIGAWDGPAFTLVGVGSGDALYACNWEADAQIAGLEFSSRYASDHETGIHTLQIDLYEGDVFEISSDRSPEGRIGFEALSPDGADACFTRGEGGEIAVGKGASGLYSLTLLTSPQNMPVLTIVREEAFDVVTLRLLDIDGSPLGPSRLETEGKARLYRRGALVPAVPFLPEETRAPFLTAFDGYTLQGGELWQGGEADRDLTLTARYAEAPNDGYHPDKDGAEYFLVGSSSADSPLGDSMGERVEALRLLPDDSYERHNVYTLAEADLFAGDALEITWGENECSRFAWIVEGDVSQQAGSERAVVERDGVYRIVISVDVSADGKVEGMQIAFTWCSPALTGYYLVGTYVSDAWVDDPENASTVWLKEEGDVWKCTITVTREMIPTWSADGERAEWRIRKYRRDGQGAQFGADASGEEGSAEKTILLGVGVWTITFSPSDLIIEWSQPWQ